MTTNEPPLLPRFLAIVAETSGQFQRDGVDRGRGMELGDHG
jgi:hypothetical protein